MTDVRGLVAEADAHARRRMRLTLLPAVILLLTLALSAVAQAATGTPPLWWLVAWAGALAGVVSMLALSRYPRTGRRAAPAQDAASPATALPRPGAAHWFAVATLAVAATLPAAAVVVLLADGNVLGALGAAAVTVLLAVVPVLALLGRSVPGELRLSPTDVRFRHGGRRWTVRWDDIVEVEVSEPLAHVRLGLADGTPGVVIALREWAVLPTDVGRLVLHYATHPEARHETSDVAAVRRRLDQLAGLPVPRRSATWRVGTDTGLEAVARQDTDPWVPVWDRAPVERTLDLAAALRARALVVIATLGLALSLATFARMGAGLLGALAGLGLATAAVAGALLVRASGAGHAMAGRRVEGGPSATGTGPTSGVLLRRSARRWWLLAVLGLGLAVTTAAVTAQLAAAWPVPGAVAGVLLVLVLLGPLLARATGLWAPGELGVDEHALTVRSGRRAVRIAWSQLTRADVLWGGVVRFEGRDGTVVRFDSRGVVASPGELVRFVERCAAAGRLVGTLDTTGTSTPAGR